MAKKRKILPLTLTAKLYAFGELSPEERMIPELWAVAEGMCEGDGNASGKELFRVMIETKDFNILEFFNHVKKCPQCEATFLRYLDKIIQLAEEG